MEVKGEPAARRRRRVGGGLPIAQALTLKYGLRDRVACWNLPAVIGGDRRWVEVRTATAPVSYTHLTLPTICSV